jgi:hypothetical protein
MNILQFVCLRAGFTPAELGLPDSVLEGAGNQPLEGVSERLNAPLYRATFWDPSPESIAKNQARSHERYWRKKAALAKGAKT